MALPLYSRAQKNVASILHRQRSLSLSRFTQKMAGEKHRSRGDHGVMIGVIVLSKSSARMHGLDKHAPHVLLPLGDRPMLQHVVESLVHQGIVRIEILLEHAPEQVSHLLGDGTRWGCSFRFHFFSQ